MAFLKQSLEQQVSCMDNWWMHRTHVQHQTMVKQEESTAIRHDFSKSFFIKKSQNTGMKISPFDKISSGPAMKVLSKWYYFHFIEDTPQFSQKGKTLSVECLMSDWCVILVHNITTILYVILDHDKSTILYVILDHKNIHNSISFQCCNHTTMLSSYT